MDQGGAEVKRSNSARAISSAIWETNSTGVFSRSPRKEDDDEEALKWAALQKLATYARVRRGIYVPEEGDIREIDIRKLGIVERKQLLERLVKIAEKDNENFLLKLKNRIERVGLDNPTIEVRFEHLNVEAKVYVGARGLPTVFNFYANAVEGLLNFLHILPSRKQPLEILHDVSGIIKPRRLTLLLGPPGSGKTTLLLALAAKLDPNLKVYGRVTYNGHNMDEFVPQRSSAYISQHDLHIGEMTVRETLAFSARCQGVGTRYDMISELTRREKEANIKPDPDIDIYMKAVALQGQQQANVVTDYIMKILGLDICADTLIGNQMVRGVSGGQKKRVTTGEMLVGPARTLFLDEISTGLDSSTTFNIVNSLRQSIHILSGTAVISLLQPAPETYNLFDDIILLSEGQIVYQGPRTNVLEFFEEMGFKCPERKGVADFLQEVTSRKDQEQYWVRSEEPYRYRTVAEFAEAFQKFHIGRSLKEELSRPFDKTKSHPAALTTKKYGVSSKELLKACVSREILLTKRNSFIYIFKAIQLTVLACICMTVFLRTTMHRNTILDGGLYLGAQYFAVTTIMFNGNAEMGMIVSRLPVLYKQRDLLMFPAWAYAIPSCIVKLPLQLIDGAVWVALTYYVIGFDPSIERFFKQYLLFLSITQMAMGLFRFLGAVSRDVIVANTCGAAAMVILLNLGGFLLSGDNVKPWWKWAYWCSPIMYAQSAIGVNEFLGKSWSFVPPNSNETLGIQVLKARGMFTEARWYWIGIGALIGFSILFNFLYTLALTYLNPLGKTRPILSEAELAERNANRTGADISLSSKQKSGSGNRSSSQVNGTSTKRGMILPFEPHSLTFDEIKYSVDMPQAMKDQGIKENRLQLLNGVSGAFRPGVLTALMGVSGAGKTTLLDVLAGRKTAGYVEGSIKISGYPKNQKTFARIAGYCEQADIHTPQVTVYESLLFSAWLRLSPDVDSASRKMFVEEVMELVELTSLRDALVGLPGVNGLSTEQRKRLTIAVELVANPSIIFMDEPTSGLDARAAAIVMRAVRNTVDTGRTVICTIHQPSIDIFDVFDELILLKRGGHQIYAGPLGQQCSQLIKYFEDISRIKIKDQQNPATWMLEVTSPAQEAALGIDFAETFKNSDLFRQNKEIIKELSSPQPGSKDLSFPTKYSQSYLNQFRACLWRKHWSYWRTPEYNAVRILFVVCIALLYGSIFWGIGMKRRNVQDINNAMGSLYGAVIFLGGQNCMSVQPILTIDRTVLYRERMAGMYAALPYAFAQALIEIPYIFTQAVLYGTIVYSTVGFEWEVTKFFWYLYFMFFCLLFNTYFGMMMVASTPNPNISYVGTSAFFSVWNIFSGFLIPVKRIPIWWRWNYYLSPFAWTLYGLAGSQFADVHDKFQSGETVQQFMESYFGFHHDFVGYVALIIAGFALLFVSVFIISIRIFNFQKR